MLLVSIMKRNYNTIQEIIDEFGIIEIVRILTRKNFDLPSYYLRDLGGCFPVERCRQFGSLFNDYVYFHRILNKATVNGDIPQQFSHVLMNLQGGIVEDILNLKIDIDDLIMALYISLVYEKMRMMFENFNASSETFCIKGRHFTYFGKELK